MTKSIKPRKEKEGMERLCLPPNMTQIEVEDTIENSTAVEDTIENSTAVVAAPLEKKKRGRKPMMSQQSSTVNVTMNTCQSQAPPPLLGEEVADKNPTVPVTEKKPRKARKIKLHDRCREGCGKKFPPKEYSKTVKLCGRPFCPECERLIESDPATDIKSTLKFICHALSKAKAVISRKTYKGKMTLQNLTRLEKCLYEVEKGPKPLIISDAQNGLIESMVTDAITLNMLFNTQVVLRKWPVEMFIE